MAAVNSADFPRSVGPVEKRKAKDGRSSHVLKKPKVDEAPLLPSLLDYDDFSGRPNCLGVVSDVSDDRIYVSLPHNHVGVAMVEEVSLADPEQIILSNHFTTGEYVVCSCLAQDTSGDTKRISISLLPERVNATRPRLKPDEVISGCVTSVEEGNYFVNVGTGDSTQVVVKAKNATKFKISDDGEPRALLVGDHVIGALKSTISSRVFELVPVKPSKCQDEPAFNSLSPGSHVLGKCLKSYHSGIVVKTCNIQAYVSRQNFEDFFQDEEQYTEGQELPFVVIFVNPIKKSVVLSMQPEHFRLTPLMSQKICRGVRMNATVVDVGSGRAVLKCNPSADTEILAFCFRKSAVDSENMELGKALPMGSEVRCRVLVHNLLEGYLLVATRKDIVDEPYFSCADAKVGELVQGTVESHQDGGLLIRISRFLAGLVPLNHISDGVTSEAKLKRFAVGRKVLARVLQTRNHRLLLTMKPAFMRMSKLKGKPERMAFEKKKPMPMVVRNLQEGCWLCSSFGSVEGLIKRIDGGTELFPGLAICARATDEVSNQGRPFFELIEVYGDYGGEGAKVGQLLKCVVTAVDKIGLNLTVSSGENTNMLLPQSELSDFPENSRLLFGCYPPESAITCMVRSTHAGMCVLTARKSFLHVTQQGFSMPTEISEVNEGDVLLGVVRIVRDKGLCISFLGTMTGFVNRSAINVPASYGDEWKKLFRPMQTVCVYVTAIKYEKNFLRCSMRNKQLTMFQRSLLSGQSFLQCYMDERQQILDALCRATDTGFPRIEPIQPRKDAPREYLSRNGQLVKLGSLDTVQTRCRIVGQDFDCEQDARSSIRPYYIGMAVDATCASFEHYVVAYNEANNTVKFLPEHEQINEFYHTGVTFSHRPSVICRVKDVEKVSDVGWQLCVDVDHENSTFEALMVVPPGFDQTTIEAFVSRQSKVALMATPAVELTQNLIGKRCMAICLPARRRMNETFMRAYTSIGYSARVNEIHCIDLPPWRTPVDAWIINFSGKQLELCLYDYHNSDAPIPAIVRDRQEGVGAVLEVGPFNGKTTTSSGFLPLTEMMDCFSKPGKCFKIGKRLKVVHLCEHEGKRIFSCRPSRLGSDWPVTDAPISFQSKLRLGEHYSGFVTNAEGDTLDIQLGVGVQAAVKQSNLVVPFEKFVSKEDVVVCTVKSCTRDATKQEVSAMATVDIPTLVLLNCINRAGQKYGGMTDEIAKLLFSDKALRRTVTSEINYLAKKNAKNALREKIRREKINRERINRERINRERINRERISQEKMSRKKQIVAEYKNDLFPDPADIEVRLDYEEEAEDVRSDSIDWNEDFDDLSALKKSAESEQNLVDDENLSVAEHSTGAAAINYERLIALDYNNSCNWIKYIAFELQQANIDAARALAEKALSTIDTRQSTERWNVWVAYLNLESLHGTEDSVSSLIARAMQENDERKVLTLMSRICQESGKLKECEVILQRICKMYPKELQPWMDLVQFRYKNSNANGAREALNHALDVLPLARNHVDLICKCAQLEFSFGLADKAKAMFEKLVSTYPKRVDIWNVYVNCLIKANQIQEARSIFRRIAQLSNVSSKRLLPLYKHFVEFERRYGDSESLAVAEDLTIVD